MSKSSKRIRERKPWNVENWLRGKHEGERAIQDFLFEFHDKSAGVKNALLLFEDNKLAGTAFVLPDNVYLLSTKALLLELQRRGLILSAEGIMDEALAKGRAPSVR